MENQVLVVGAGAAGLWAAARAAEAGAQVTLLEKTPRTGTKVLASGGTRCNLTTTLGAQAAGQLFGKKGSRFLRHALRILSPLELRRQFDVMGVPTVEAPLDKVFPESNRARDVRDALEARTLRAGVKLHVDCAVRAVQAGSAGWKLSLDNGKSLSAERLILCPGGKSYARTGSTGDGYGWLAELDLPLVEPVPALVPLTSPDPWVQELSGVSLQAGELRLYDPDGKLCSKRSRPVLFTHRGLSGPGVLDVSVAVARARAAGETRLFEVRLDLQPGTSREELVRSLREAGSGKGSRRLRAYLPDPLPRRLLAAALRQAGSPEEDPLVSGMTKDQRHRFIEAIKGLSIPIDGTLGFDRAEVTSGGLDVACVDPGSMAVRGREGLFVCGELLDLDGPIGGLNFQAAFSTAELAGQAAARRP